VPHGGGIAAAVGIAAHLAVGAAARARVDSKRHM
jgi:hypothetical protein